MLFDGFFGIDWSGDKSKYQKGIKVAYLDKKNTNPVIIVPPSKNKYWDRSSLIEYLQNFLKNFELARFYFDRPFYYSANAIHKLFKNTGMQLYDIEKIDVHGGSLRCYIKNCSNYKVTKRCKRIYRKKT